MTDQRAQITWTGGVPASARFGDPYYSLDDGPAETAHVFLAGNDLPERFAPGFHIAELGFGTGLNLLVALRAAQARSIPIRYTAFEAFPMAPSDMTQALAAFPELSDDAGWMVDAWAHGNTFSSDWVDVHVILGDARKTLPLWPGRADAWFLDGFAPAKNPELWEPLLLAEVARHTAPGGTAATYTAAGHVRRALAAAGFAVSRRPGFGRKRHMTVAHRL
ncbi:MAG: tRNA (5-methylaminomethyl-2-thiouridine)(34)-methyltransferase MnmD [Pseudomonadota bacterium]